MKKINLLSILAILTSSFMSLGSADTATPVCDHQYSDFDGDGFGWENSATCIVTEDSEPPPTFINGQTGQLVELIRPYWDGNNDIANRTIRCDLHHFDDISRNYVTSGINLDFDHLPIPSTSPYLGWLDVRSSNGAPWWTIDDGLYEGRAILNSRYIEPVTNTDGAKAIRAWLKGSQNNQANNSYFNPRTGEVVLEHSEDAYFHCYDLSGEDFGPTGQPNQAATIEYELADLTFTVSAEIGDLASDQQIVNLETGQPVILQTAYWDYNTDLAGKTMDCAHYTWRGDSYVGGISQPVIYTFNYQLEGHDNRIRYHRSFEGIQSNSFFELENDVLQRNNENVFNGQLVEITDFGMRYWRSSEGNTTCFGAQPTGSAPLVNDLATTNTTTSESVNQPIVESTSVTGTATINTSGGGALSWSILLMLIGLLRLNEIQVFNSP